MKMINNKGFMLAEIIIVSAILATALVGLFATFSKMFIEYEKRSVYSSIDAIYVSRGIAMHYKNLITFTDEEKTKGYRYKKIASNEFTKKYNVVDSYKIKYDLESFNNLLASETALKEKYKEYLNYLKNNLDFNDGSCNYIIVTELSDNCENNEETNEQECKEDNANVSLGYYKIN